MKEIKVKKKYIQPHKNMIEEDEEELEIKHRRKNGKHKKHIKPTKGKKRTTKPDQ